MQKKEKRRSSVDKLAVISAVALSMNQVMVSSVSASAKELEYDGTTQMTTEDFTLDVDPFASELIIEEVYVQAGMQVAAGDQILKLTSDSYQEALDYYEASVIRAENELTDTQREYDQGVLEAEYNYEKAKMEADQAEFVRDYQQDELERTITDHEEIQTEITDRIAELEAGSSSGSGFSGDGSGGGRPAGDASERESPEPETEMPVTESETTPGTEQIPGETTPGTEQIPGEMAPDTERTPGETTPGTEQVPGESTPGTEQVPGESTPGTEEVPGETVPDTEEDMEQQIKELKQQIETASQSCDAILEQLMTLLVEKADSDGSEQEDGPSTEQTEQSSLQSELQASIDGDTVIYGHMQNLQKMVENISDEMIDVAEMAGIDCQEYIDLLNECTVQMEKNIAAQQAVQSGLAEIEDSENAGSGEEAAEIDVDLVRELLNQFAEVGLERSSLYQQLMSFEEKQLTDYKELAESRGKQIEEQQTQIESLQAQIAQLQEGGASEENHSPSETENGALLPSRPDSDDSFSMPSGSEGGFSAPSGSVSGGGSGPASGGAVGVSGSFAGSADIGTAGGSMSMEDLNLTEEDISLFGDMYDLSQIENMLEREPSDSDEAQELIGQLEDEQDTIRKQYGELTRNKKATELKIQYTYDSAILSGKLAEITYEQELQEWEETLAEARENKADLEEKKQALEAMTDGIVTAEEGGTIAAVNYEAEDVLSSMTPLLSFYNTDVVTVTIAVPQEDIALFQVGGDVEVILSGVRSQTGTITEKSLEAQEGTSKTVVDYEVTVSVDNEGGRLSAGTPASVRINTAADAENESEEDQNE